MSHIPLLNDNLEEVFLVCNLKVFEVGGSWPDFLSSEFCSVTSAIESDCKIVVLWSLKLWWGFVLCEDELVTLK